jgi:hypothetical protein
MHVNGALTEVNQTSICGRVQSSNLPPDIGELLSETPQEIQEHNDQSCNCVDMIEVACTR